MGFVAHHLLEPDESLRTNSLSDTRLPMRYTIHLGTEFDLASHSLYTSKVRVFHLVFYFLNKPNLPKLT